MSSPHIPICHLSACPRPTPFGLASARQPAPPRPQSPSDILQQPTGCSRLGCARAPGPGLLQPITIAHVDIHRGLELGMSVLCRSNSTFNPPVHGLTGVAVDRGEEVQRRGIGRDHSRVVLHHHHWLIQQHTLFYLFFRGTKCTKYTNGTIPLVNRNPPPLKITDPPGHPFSLVHLVPLDNPGTLASRPITLAKPPRPKFLHPTPRPRRTASPRPRGGLATAGTASPAGHPSVRGIDCRLCSQGPCSGPCSLASSASAASAASLAARLARSRRNFASSFRAAKVNIGLGFGFLIGGSSIAKKASRSNFLLMAHASIVWISPMYRHSPLCLDRCCNLV
jgi:hypothetical protein